MNSHSFLTLGSSIRAGVFAGDVAQQAPWPAQMVKQVHGTSVVRVDSLGPVLVGDALMTRSPGFRLLIKTADCLPIVLSDESTGWIAAVHAGWRGLTAGVLLQTLTALQKEGVLMEHLRVGVGPSLGLECAFFSKPYEEIPSIYHWAITDGRVDLWAIAEHQLLSAGVLADRVEWMRICTACSPEWFSWRRDHGPERFGTWIERLP